MILDIIFIVLSVLYVISVSLMVSHDYKEHKEIMKRVYGTHRFVKDENKEREE